MRKLLYSLFFISLTLISCGETSMSQLEKQAIETFKASFIPMGEDNKDIQFNNLKNVFSSNNLCILNADISSNKVTKKVEYLFLTLDGKNYEAYQDLDDDSVFVSETTFNKTCKGTIYENQDYATAILFRSVNYINAYGREVGNHKTDFFINSPLKTGAWELCGVADEFGEIVDGKCLRLVGKGTYSTKYENDENLLALLFVGGGNSCYLKLLKNGSRVVDDFGGDIKIKDGEGNIHNIYFSDREAGAIVPFEGKQEFRAILDKEGVLSALANVGGGLFSSSSRCSYKFKFHLRGLKNAMRFLQPSKSASDEQDKDLKSENEEYDLDMELESVNKKDIQFSTPELESVDEALESRKEAVNTTDESIHDFCDKFPVFEGGDILEWVSNHKRIDNARAKVSFVVEKDGSTSNIKVLSGHEIVGVPEEAIRLVKMMKWLPGIKDDKPVRSQYNLTLYF